MESCNDMSRFVNLPSVLVYTETMTPRLRAALDWAFQSVLGIGWVLEMDREKYHRSEASWKLQYGGAPICGFHIHPEGLLQEQGWRATPPDEGEGADWLALIFWMGSRMEEGCPGAPRDLHGRFDPTGSEPERRGWLEKPVCELWAFELGSVLLGHQWPEHLARLQSEYRVQPTLDIDSAYAFKGKGLWRTGAALARDVAFGRLGTAAHRWRACTGKLEDAYDTYAQLGQWHDEWGLTPKWFFLLARFGRFDKGLPSDSPQLARLMHALEERHPGSVQWHPGYDAAANPQKMREEWEAYTKIMGQAPVSARQHYLRMIPGLTRRTLCALGIAEDHTEGHAVRTGFRGGFCRPRNWYDLEREESTPLTIHPFVAMDATLSRYMGMSPKDAPMHMAGLAEQVKAVGGPLRTLWHNESLSGEGEWRGWTDVYPNVLQVAN